jgi:RNA polymerase sigma-70 factor (ECF subfamily)
MTFNLANIALRWKQWGSLRALFALPVPSLPGNGEEEERLRKQELLHPGVEERELLRAIAGNDADAFRTFYELTSSRVYGYCLKMGKSVQVATELLQETYITLWQGRKHLINVTYPRAYLIRIASRAVYRYLSHKNNSRQILELYEADQLLQPEIAGHVSLETKEILQMIEIAVRQLPPQQQEVFRLNKYEGLSYKEIADQLHISVSTVGNYLDIAMRKVRASVLGG